MYAGKTCSVWNRIISYLRYKLEQSQKGEQKKSQINIVRTTPPPKKKAREKRITQGLSKENRLFYFL